MMTINAQLTRQYDTEHPQVLEDQEGEQVELKVSHILRRAIAVFKAPITRVKKCVLPK